MNGLEEALSASEDLKDTILTQISMLQTAVRDTRAHNERVSASGLDEDAKADVLRDPSPLQERLAVSQKQLAKFQGCLDEMLSFEGLTPVIAELVLRAGANSNSTRMSGTPVVSHAVMFGRYEIAITLLAHGAKVNERDSSGKSPLHYACKGRFPSPCKESVRCLLQAGAHPTALSGMSWNTTESCKTPEELLGTGHEEIRLLLRRVDTRRRWGWIDMLRKRASRETGGVVETPVIRRRSARLGTPSVIGAVKFLQRGAPDNVFHIVMRFL